MTALTQILGTVRNFYLGPFQALPAVVCPLLWAMTAFYFKLKPICSTIIPVYILSRSASALSTAFRGIVTANSLAFFSFSVFFRFLFSGYMW